MENKKQSFEQLIIGIIVVIIGIILDQYTKFLAITKLKDRPISIIDGVFELQYLENKGAAFGILQNQQWLFLLIGIPFSIIAFLFYIRLPKTKKMLPVRYCVLFTITGTIGNLIDRIRFSYVVDFLYFKLIDFPIFNVADIFVSVSAIIIVILLIFVYNESEIDQMLNIKRKKYKLDYKE